MNTEYLKNDRAIMLVTGLVGLLAAVLTGAGEFLLHFDPLARFSESSYDFMLAGSEQRQTLGHFIGVLGAPLYVVGCWHIYLMLKPAGPRIAFIAFILGAYGFMVGADWIGSRASIGALMHFQETGGDVGDLIALYQLRYETLLTVVRVTTLSLSLIFIGLVVTGRSHYRRWQVVFSPIVLLIGSFIVYALAPEIGKYVMPIALNVAFGIFFVMSLLQMRTIKF